MLGIKTGNGMPVHMEEESESVAACAQIKDDIKQMKTTWLIQYIGGDHISSKTILAWMKRGLNINNNYWCI